MAHENAMLPVDASQHVMASTLWQKCSYIAPYPLSYNQFTLLLSPYTTPENQIYRAKHLVFATQITLMTHKAP